MTCLFLEGKRSFINENSEGKISKTYPNEPNQSNYLKKLNGMINNNKISMSRYTNNHTQ